MKNKKWYSLPTFSVLVLACSILVLTPCAKADDPIAPTPISPNTPTSPNGTNQPNWIEILISVLSTYAGV